MSYIGIDASYSGLGFAVCDPTCTIQSWLGKFPPDKHGTGVERLEDIQDWVIAQFRLAEESHGNISGVALEGYANGAKFGREIAGELGAAVKLAMRMHFNDAAAFPHIVTPSSLKLFATGKGNSPKEQILLAVYKKYGIEGIDNNRADAIVLAHIAQSFDFPGGLLAYEKKAMEKVTAHTEMRRP